MKAFVHTNERYASAAVLVLRIALGLVMFAHGAQKVLGVFGGKGLPESVTGMSAGLGIPLPLAYLSAFTEFLGGLGILIGLLTRFFSIAVTINMFVAVFAVHMANGFFAPAGFEFPLTLALVALAIVIIGPGRYSVDHRLFSTPRDKVIYKNTTVPIT